MAGPRILLADDHNLILGAFKALLAPECDIVGTASDGRSLVAEAQRRMAAQVGAAPSKPDDLTVIAYRTR